MKKLLLTGVLALCILTSYGQNWSEIVKLEASDQQIDDNLGSAVAIDGNYAIAGASHEGSFGVPPNNAGAAYIFYYNASTDTWTEEAKLVAADREASDLFGISVGISGTYAVVGAVQEDGARGAAYVFERNGSGTWVQVAKLTATSTQANDRFGVSVAISGDRIIVGAEHEDEDAADGNTMQNAGSAYIFTRSGGGVWSFSQKIVASDRETNSSFGNSVAIDGTKVIVGAYRTENASFVETGAAYAFAFSSGSWSQTKKLTSSFITTQDRFGWSVDISGDYYIVGAPYYDYDDTGANFNNNAGGAFIFDESNAWAEDRIVEGDRHGQDNFGNDVAIYNTRAVVGTPFQNFGLNGDPPNLGDGGAAFVFERNGSGIWNQTQKLLASDRFSGDKFGYSVDLTDTTIISGAVEDNSTSSGLASTGAMYIFQDTTLSLDDEEGISSAKAFPNPIKNDLTIDLKRNYVHVSVTIYNLSGQLVYRQKYTNTNFIHTKIKGASGVYFVKLLTSEKEEVTLKVVKE